MRGNHPGSLSLLRPLVESSDEVHINTLLLSQNAQRSKLPPLVRSEVGADLRLWTPAAEPLDEVEVVGLQQPFRDLDESRVASEARFRVRMVHEPKDALLRRVA